MKKWQLTGIDDPNFWQGMPNSFLMADEAYQREYIEQMVEDAKEDE